MSQRRGRRAQRGAGGDNVVDHEDLTICEAWPSDEFGSMQALDP